MRLTRLAIATLLLVGLAGPAVPVLATSAHSATTTKRVLADNFRWCKPSTSGCVSADENHRTRVVVGTRVKWIYNDTECDAIAFCPGHNVKFAHHAKSADVKTDGAVIASRVFNRVGRYDYWCTNHRSQGMTGRIRVVSG
jgi:hypothetical protein